jgi:hypothetical protein
MRLVICMKVRTLAKLKWLICSKIHAKKFCTNCTYHPRLSTHESIFRVQIIMRKESGRSFVFDPLTPGPKVPLYQGHFVDQLLKMFLNT